ncbi:hypothetical protein EDB92DRAFT_1816242 [Lactarius akahatsu]|uniref:Uncharacterized protein n=1 Tax=Lactarius akahatsu TaxID=416441 RepID=A0AAD4LGR1_9AGAM|nr:hypothetical protein EDB92DRAFT_1816242 [Lactarius akahatsu]
MCPKSCMAYTGDSHSQSTCSYKDCNELRYKPQQSSTAKAKPRATMLYMPITPIIQVYYANAETSHEMCHRDECLKSTLNLLASGAGVKKSGFANSDNHISHYTKLGLFDDGRDTALMKSQGVTLHAEQHPGQRSKGTSNRGKVHGQVGDRTQDPGLDLHALPLSYTALGITSQVIVDIMLK